MPSSSCSAIINHIAKTTTTTTANKPQLCPSPWSVQTSFTDKTLCSLIK
jgi:hypothetical protein